MLKLPCHRLRPGPCGVFLLVVGLGVVSGGENDRGVVTDADRDFWSFRPVRVVAVPNVDDGWVRKGIDGFVLEGIREAGLEPAAEASRRHWLRRVSFGLTGLPPTVEELRAFEGDGEAGAYERVVERLLESPRYGEKWASHWLDGVRYVEEVGYYNFGKHGWRYRDWVIRALNADLGYDKFVSMQIAGDLMPEAGGEGIEATGFLCMGNYDDQESDKDQLYSEVADDQIDVITRQFLGLTVACARCHDHKFDPIPTRDYYAMAGIFMSTRVLGTESRIGAKRLEVPLPDGGVAMAAQEGAYANSRLKAIGDMPVYLRGDYKTPGEVVPRGVLQVIAGKHGGAIGERTEGSGRLELARWIADAENPLTARVMANRVWQRHFGYGLVRTPSNFGALGERPTHPELLDWLAARFVEGGWSLKALQREMVLSATYRQESDVVVSVERDPENRLFARFPRRRLTAEEIHDGMLFVGGRLKLGETRGGQARAVYTHTGHLKPWRFGQIFDSPPTGTMLASRDESAVAPQALFLMNDAAVIGSARGLAGGGGEVRERVAAAYLTLYAREATAEELRRAEAYLGRVEKPWTFFQVLLCSNEFLYVE